jgi:tetratricopeptide (TPR) repeat protein
MSFASLLVTHAIQQSAGAVSTLSELPVAYRVLNAFTSYGGYIGKMVMPFGLAVLYPFHKEGVPVGPAILSFGLLALSAMAVHLWWRKHPYILVGSLWYVGTLFPVIGLVQVGAQTSADRYTYFPLVGIFIIIVWGGANIILAKPALRNFAIWGLGIWLLLLSSLSYQQAQTWHDSESVWRQAIAVTKGNYTAQANLGGELATQGRSSEAESALHEAIRIAPADINAYVMLAGLYLQEGAVDRSLQSSEFALRLNPGFPAALAVHANALIAKKRYAEAERDLQECLRHDSVSWLFPASLGDVLELQGKTAEALAAYEEGLSRSPNEPYILYKMALAKEKAGAAAEAEQLLSRALAHSPEYAEALGAMSRLKAKSGYPKEALELAIRACSLTHDRDLRLLLVLAEARLANGETKEAVRIGEKLLAHAPPNDKDFKSDVEALLARAR